MKNISRIQRRNRNDLNLISKGGVFDLFDNTVKQTFRINDLEYDYICEHISDEELDLLVKDNLTLAEKRELLLTLDKYLHEFYNNQNGI